MRPSRRACSRQRISGMSPDSGSPATRLRATRSATRPLSAGSPGRALPVCATLIFMGDSCGGGKREEPPWPGHHGERDSLSIVFITSSEVDLRGLRGMVDIGAPQIIRHRRRQTSTWLQRILPRCGTSRRPITGVVSCRAEQRQVALPKRRALRSDTPLRGVRMYRRPLPDLVTAIAQLGRAAPAHRFRAHARQRVAAHAPRLAPSRA